MTTTERVRPIDCAALLPGESTSIRLVGTCSWRGGVKSISFGHLVKIAGSDGRFRGDLYHDARWIDMHVMGETTFCYGCDDDGTIIGSEGQYIFPYRRRFYTCRIRCDWSQYSPGEGEWFLDVVRHK